MKILVILTVWYFIKFFFMTCIFINMLLLIESNSIINKKMFLRKDNTFSNYCIKPIKYNFNTENEDIPYLIYIIHHNILFDITHGRIKYGFLFLFRTLTLKTVLIRFFFIYFNLSFFLFKIILIVLKINNKQDLVFFLNKIAHNPSDDRILINENNKWKHNDKFRQVWDAMCGSFTFKQASPAQLIKLHEKLFKIYNNMETLNKDSYFTQQKVIIKEISSKNAVHEAHPDLANLEGYIPYQTNFLSAKNNDFYNKTPLIPKYQGPKKISTELLIEEKKTIVLSDPKETSIINFAFGASTEYREEYASKKLIIATNEAKYLSAEFEELTREFSFLENKQEKLMHLFQRTVTTDYTSLLMKEAKEL